MFIEFPTLDSDEDEWETGFEEGWYEEFSTLAGPEDDPDTGIARFEEWDQEDWESWQDWDWWEDGVWLE
jgi:hypothetical protein